MQVNNNSTSLRLTHSDSISHSIDSFVCPKCQGTLGSPSAKKNEPSSIICVDCTQDFPALTHGIIVFFEQPEQAIAKSYSRLYNTATRWQNQAHALSETLKKSNRKQALLPILKAQHDNREIFEQWAQAIEKSVSPSALMEVKKESTQQTYGYSFNYLVRDWTTDPNSVLEVNKILAGLKRAIRLCSTRGRACVLGMGTGRLALELGAFFDDIHGIDNSLGQVLQYHELLERDISFWRINSKNQSHQHNIVSKQLASIPGRLKAKSSKVKYAWGDALNTPYKDDFFDWVFSIYFSDVQPLPDLLKEVKRVLRSGGLFVHCGPLEYHFSDVEHHYSFDEFRDYFLSNGFELLHESSCENLPTVNPEKTLVTQRQYNDKVLLLRLR